MKKIILILFINLYFFNVGKSQEYNASLFGCVSDGVTNNTSSIQYAIDFIAEKGGGKLNFYVGRYITGSLKLRSNVTIELHEGAVLSASPNINDYLKINQNYALLIGENISQFNLIGKGVVEVQTKSMEVNMKKINESGILTYSSQDYPNLIILLNSKNVKIDGIMFLNGNNAAININNSENIVLENLIIKSKASNSEGILLTESKNLALKNIYIDVVKRPSYKSSNTTITSLDKCITPNGKSIL